MTDQQRNDTVDAVKWFGLTQFAVIAPMAAVVLCPPAAIPLTAVGAGIWKSFLKRTSAD